MTATTSQRAEFSRKSRTFLRGLTALFGNAALLNPAALPGLRFILWSHKLHAVAGAGVARCCAWCRRSRCAGSPCTRSCSTASSHSMRWRWRRSPWPGDRRAVRAGAPQRVLPAGECRCGQGAAACGSRACGRNCGSRRGGRGERARTPAARPVRVLHLRDSPWVDGPGRTILETATRIDRSRVDYHVGAFVSNPRAASAGGRAASSVACRCTLSRIAAGVGREIVQCDRRPARPAADRRSPHLGVPLERARPAVPAAPTRQAREHGARLDHQRPARARSTRLADRVLLRRFDRVILVSHAMRRRLPRWWVPDERVRVLHNALMTESYGRACWTRRDRYRSRRGHGAAAERRPPVAGEGAGAAARGRGGAVAGVSRAAPCVRGHRAARGIS